MKPLMANSLWFAACLPEALAFQRATRDVARVQSTVLHQILQRSPALQKIRTAAEFQQKVPLSNEPQPTSEPVLRRVPTSGTTAATKWIPYTASLGREFQRGISPWIVDLFRHEPSLMSGKAYWAISPVSQTGEGFGDDTEYLGASGRLVSATLAVPPAIRHIGNLNDWRKATLQHLVNCPDLAFISVWNPTFLTLLLEPLWAQWPNQEPARLHQRLWPRLRVISCWADGAAASPAKELKELFPQAIIQPKGLIATEGFVSLPLWKQDGAALALRSHFFEFQACDGSIRLAHELEEGGEYSVILTTSGGLHRYPLRDRIQVTGFLHECPLLRFLGKDDSVSDHFGEKLAERQVDRALTASLSLTGIEARFAMLACEGKTYTLFIESAGNDVQLAELAEKMESILFENIHYRYCRELGQLEELQVFRVTGNAARDYLTAQCARGQRLGEIKSSRLSRYDGWTKVFQGDYIQFGLRFSRKARTPSWQSGV